jgi:eukaryotic-like serine/threonine-protein kinase
MTCLTDVELRLLHTGQAPSDKVFSWRAHVGSCETCSAQSAKIEATETSSDKFDRYVVIAEVGRGASGRVFKAVDPVLERTVALKVLRDELRSKEENQRLLAEARTLAKLSHPNVATIFDAGETQGGVFFAMEFLSGETLEQWLEKKHTPPEILQLFLNAGQGLAAAHKLNIVHRDFKPANVVLSDGVAKVTDFGLATVGTAATATSSGTPRFMAPEHKLGQSSEKSDQFSFAICLKLALEAQGSIPKWMVVILEKATAAQAENRFENMGQLLTALENDPAIKRRRLLTIAAVALSVSLGIAGVVQSQRKLEHSCDDAGQKANNVVSVARLDSIEKRLGVFQSKENELSGVNQLKTWKNTWEQLAQSTCSETKIKGVQSGALFDLKQLCLERKLVFVDALLESADEKTSVNKLAEALADLPNLKECSDEKALVTQSESETPAQREKAKPVREMIEKVEALSALGMDSLANRMVAEIIPKARMLPTLGPLSQALVLSGQFENLRGKREEGERLLGEAYSLAVQSRTESVAARASTEILRMHTEDPVFVNTVSLFVENAISRTGQTKVWDCSWFLLKGDILFDQAHYKEAVSQYSTASNACAQYFGKANPRTIFAERARGIALENDGQIEEAVSVYAATHELDRQLFGEKSVLAARSLAIFGGGLCAAGQLVRAKEKLLLAKGVLEPLAEYEQSAYFTVLDGLALIEEQERSWSTALRYRTEIELKVTSPYLRALNRGYMSRTLLETGDLEKAKEYSLSAISYVEKIDKRHPNLLIPLIVLSSLETKNKDSLLDRAAALPKNSSHEFMGELFYALAQNATKEKKAAFLEAARNEYKLAGSAQR